MDITTNDMEIGAVVYGALIAGAGFIAGKYPELIAGYNTMPAEKRKNVDIIGLSKFLQKGLMVTGAAIIVVYFLSTLFVKDETALKISTFGSLAAIIALVISSDRFDHNPKKWRKRKVNGSNSNSTDNLGSHKAYLSAKEKQPSKNECHSVNSYSVDSKPPTDNGDAYSGSDADNINSEK